MGDRVELNSGNKSAMCFFFKAIEVYELESNGKVDCVGIKPKGVEDVFLQFYNHSK